MRFRKAISLILSVALMFSGSAIPAFGAEAQQDVHYIENIEGGTDQTFASSENEQYEHVKNMPIGNAVTPEITGIVETNGVSSVLRSRASGVLQGNYASMKWALNLDTGAMSISGSGAVANIWRDSSGNEYSNYIKTVTVSSGITELASYAFAYCENLRSISLPETVTKLGTDVFVNCKSLTTVNIPSKVTAIPDYAFAGCEKLAGIVLPGNLTSIGPYAFALCAALEKINYPSKLTQIQEAAFYGCVKLGDSALPASLTSIGNYAFFGCAALKQVSIPCPIGEQAYQECTSLTSISIKGNIGLGAFQRCTALKEATLANTVTEIGPGAFNMCSSLQKITIPSGVNRIQERAFGGCDTLYEVVFSGGCQYLDAYAFVNSLSLKKITLPSDLLEIGEYCFAVSSLESVTIPQSVKTIGICAFALCPLLKSANIPAGLDTLGENCFQECTKLETVQFPEKLTGGLNSIGEYTFLKCTSLKSVQLPKGITAVGNGAFSTCSSLQSVELPEGLLSLGGGVLGECPALETLNIPDSCKTIGEQAFYGCKLLKTVHLPVHLEEISSALFYRCVSLKEINIPESVQKIGDHAFVECKMLNGVTLPAKLDAIGDFAFINCVKLNVAAIPNQLRSIGKDAFANTALTKVTLPASVVKIGEEAFAMCRSLESAVMPEGITEVPRACFLFCERLKTVQLSKNTTVVGAYAFAECSSMERVNLPATIESIGESAFVNCRVLESVALTDALMTIGKEAFVNCASLEEIYIGSKVAEVGEYAFSGCTGMKNMSVSSANKQLKSVNGVLYSKDGSELIFYPPLNAQQTFTVPQSLSTIAAGALYKCVNIRNIVFSENITKIEARTFYGCSGLEQVVIPENITSIGEYAFAYCENLKQVELNDKITEVGEGAFAYCSSLTELKVPDQIAFIPAWLAGMCSSLREIHLPDGVEKIGESAFFGCEALEQVTLPSGLSEIGNMAFADCDSLSEITIPAGIELIPGGMMKYCDQLESVTLKGGVYYIGDEAFSNCISLKNVYFAGNAPQTIGKDAFLNTGSEMVFHCKSSSEGFTVPAWNGPDGDEYHTVTVYSGSCGTNVTWELDTLTGLMLIGGKGQMANYAAEEERPWHAFRNLIREVRIAEGITRLGSYNFADCQNLEKVSLPESLNETNYAAFANCIWLSECSMPGGLKNVAPCLFYNCYLLEETVLNEDCTEIGEYAFFDCRSLQHIVLPEGVTQIGEGSFAYCINMDEVVIKGALSSIDSGAFIGCDSLQSVYLEAGLPKNISEYAFTGIEHQLKLFAGEETLSWKGSDGNEYNTTSSESLTGKCGSSLSWSVLPKERKLIIEGTGAMNDYEENQAPWSQFSFIIEQLQVEEGITSLGDFAFANLYGVQSVNLPESLNAIGDYSFAGCVALKEAALPANVQLVGEGVFSTCPLLKTAVLPEKLTAIPAYLFYGCTGLENVNIPLSVRSIGYSAFTGCAALEAIELPDGIHEIDDYAFAACVSLTEVHLPAALEKLGDSALIGCSELARVEWNQKLTEIGTFAFAQTSLTEIALPDSLKTIGGYAFYLCDALSAVDLANTESIGEYAFGHTAIEEITLPETVAEVGRSALIGCRNLAAIESESAVYTSVNGVLYCGNLLVQYPAGKRDEIFVLPGKITGVDAAAFYGNSYLKQVELGDQVNTLGEAAFALCDALETVSLGSGITLLPEAMFGQCVSLKEIHFYGNAPNSIGRETFAAVPEGITFYYDLLSSGWTEGKWTGPDGVSYKTVAVEIGKLLVGDVQVMLDRNGYARAALQITAQGQSPIEIVSVKVSDERFAADFASENRLVNPGEIFDTCCIVPTAALDASGKYAVEVTIAWARGSAKCSVTFEPNDSMLYTLKVEDPYDVGPGGFVAVFEEYDVFVTVDSSSLVAPREGVVVLGVFRNEQMIASGAGRHLIQPSGNYTFIFTVANCDVSKDCQYRAFLLDAGTLAPLTDFAQCRSYMEYTASGGTEAPIQLFDVQEYIRERSVSAADMVAEWGAEEKTATSVITVDPPYVLTSRSFIDDVQNAWAGKTKLTLIADKDGNEVLGLSISRKDQYVRLDFNKKFEKNWSENLTDPEYKDTSAVTASAGGFYSWAKSTSNAHKGPRNGFHLGIKGYLFRREQADPTKLLGFDNGWMLEGTPAYELLSGSLGVELQAKKWGKHTGSVSADALKGDYEFHLKNENGDSVLKVKISGSVGSFKKDVSYIPGAQKKYRWKGKFGRGLAGGEFEIEMDLDALSSKLGDWATDTVKELGEKIHEHVFALAFEHEDETYDLGEWYIYTGEEGSEIVPLSFVALDETRIDASLPMIVDKALPSLNDLNLTFTNEGGLVEKPPVIQTQTSSEQMEIRSALDILTSGSAAEKAALARAMYMASGGGTPLPQDMNTIAGFMSSGMFNNFTEMQNSLSSGIYRDGNYLTFPEVNQGFVLQGYVVENVYR